jgi:superfamily II DNA or RNA helicase
MKVYLPPVFAIHASENGSAIRQLAAPAWQGEADVEPLAQARAKGYLIQPQDESPSIVLLVNTSQPRPQDQNVLRLKGFTLPAGDQEVVDLSAAKWLKHPAALAALATIADYEHRTAEVRAFWDGRFAYKQENIANATKGLRPPQLGALHAAQAHLSVHHNPATVVLPTGTGKTETMLSILVAERCGRLLVIVPTDALRTQISDKFLTLGVLKDFGIVAPDTKYPVVGTLNCRPKAVKEVDSLFRKCNVIVATMAGLGQCPEKIQERIASHCTHLFIDEAHHVGAPTWEAFKKVFEKVPIIQFTATPYRNDEKPIGGQLIFNYPLRQAQEDGYFTPITFKPVLEFDPKLKDQAIAEAAVEQLRADAAKGHVVMARVSSVPRAEQVFKIYQAYPEFNPVQLHTGIKSSRVREQIRKQILSGKSRIVVCVDMLGEGFDLPELKIAAFHDIRHSLPVTLQLAGRFTRSRPDLGNATFIANIAEVEVKDELRKLYQHDVDWNRLLPQISEKAIQQEFDLWEFLGGFRKFPEELSLQNVRPAMSTVVYRTRCKDWHPENFQAGIKGFSSLERVYHDVNPKENTLIIMTTERVPVDWAGIDEIYSWDWQLYILHWDKDNRLLFIHNSSNSGFFKELAKAVAGDAKLINGPEIFRCLATVNRLRFQNVGLLQQIGRLIRFTMRAGPDVESGMSEAAKQKAIKSNLFGTGYENGHRTSIGCSYKGRIWSQQTTNLRQLTRWCRSVGEKLIDSSLDPEQVLHGTLEPMLVSDRPEEMPIAVEWPEIMYRDVETAYTLRLQGIEVGIHETDLSLLGPAEKGSLQFAVSGLGKRAVFELELFARDGEPDFRFKTCGGSIAEIVKGGTKKSLCEFFNDEPPTFWFVNGASLVGHRYVRLRSEPEPFPRQRIDVWDWSGIDITKESQKIEKRADSIQYRVLETLKKKPYTVLFDDDDSGEAADIVAICETKTVVEIDFYHCKFSGDASPGARIKDLYEVCGQAQRSIHWMERPVDLFSHLMRREPRKSDNATGTRFEVGKQDDLVRIREKCRRMDVRLKILIVQPGLSRKAATRAQLELLSVTEHYLMDTFKIPFTAIGSE